MVTPFSFPYFLSRAVSLSFLFNLTQTNKATNEIYLIERERERSTSLSHIYPPPYLSIIIMSNKELLREYTDPAIYNSHHERFERLGLPQSQEEWIQRAAGMSFHPFRCLIISSRVVCTPPTKIKHSLSFFSKKKARSKKNYEAELRADNG